MLTSYIDILKIGANNPPESDSESVGTDIRRVRSREREDFLARADECSNRHVSTLAKLLVLTRCAMNRRRAELQTLDESGWRSQTDRVSLSSSQSR